MSTSVIYRSARGYELLMRALYGRHYGDRMRVVAAQVPEGASVLELCCGPGTLYRKYLRGKTGSYLGLDVNRGFVEQLRADGIDARQFDIADGSTPLPSADVVIIQASLYHFLPHADRVLERMLAAAGERVIAAEPIRNLADNRIPLISWMSARATDPGVGGHEARFTEATLDRLMNRYSERMLTEFLIPGGREKVYVLSAAPDPPVRLRDRSGTEVGL